jgi:hypothetical protein
MIGKVCACSKGIIGVVTAIHTTKLGQRVYSGLNMRGGSWQSVQPTIIADSLEDYINSLVEKQVYAQVHRLKGNLI